MSATAADVVRTFWDHVAASRWPEAQALLDDDVTITWPATGERFRTAARYIAMNAAFPTQWSIDEVDVVGDADTGDGRAVVHAVVRDEHGTHHCASFCTVSGGRITAATELWVSERSEVPPAWRGEYAERELS
jgi:ketosteroid isomerase-like protein